MERGKSGSVEEGTALDPQRTISSAKHGGGIVIAWACMAAPGPGSGVFIDDETSDGSNRLTDKM